MRVLVLLVLVAAACSKAEPDQCLDKLDMAARGIDLHVDITRKMLRENKLDCATMLDQHEEQEAIFSFLVFTMEVYKTPLKARFDALAAEMNRLRADIKAGRGCLQLH